MHRYYWGAKMSKDFVILTGNQKFSYSEVEGYFKDRVILNYLNEMLIEASDRFIKTLIEQGGVTEAALDEG